MRTVRVLCGAAVTAAVVSLIAACGDTPTAPETGARAIAPRALISAPAADNDTSFITTTSISSDEQPADTSGTRRGVQMGGGGN